MLLQSLKQYDDRRFIPAGRLYNYAPVRYQIELDSNRGLLGLTTRVEGEGKREHAITMEVPQRDTRTSGVEALLLVGNAEYTLGLSKSKVNKEGKKNKAGKEERFKECHNAYKELLRECIKELGKKPEALEAQQLVRVVLTFLENDPVSQLQQVQPNDLKELDRTANITFVVDGKLLVDLPAVRQFWADHHAPEKYSDLVTQCLVCGECRTAVRLLEFKVKGVPDSATGGLSLISANESPYWSYGLEHSHIAPVCALCSERFVKALNYLLGRERQDNHLAVGSTVFTFWTREPMDVNPVRILKQPDDEQMKRWERPPKPLTPPPAEEGQVRSSLEAPIKGGSPPQVEANRFYAITLTASTARAVVRDWIDITIPDVQRNVTRWFANQRIVKRNGEMGKLIGVYTLLTGMVRSARQEGKPPSQVQKEQSDIVKKDLKPATFMLVLRAALTGSLLPKDLLHKVVARCRTERDEDGRPVITHQRAALIKLILLSQQTHKEDDVDKLDVSNLEQLNRSNREYGYLCGRLFAIMERAQRLALPSAKSGIGSFFGTATTMPAAVFPRLVRGVQAHLRTLARDKPGAYRNLDRQITEILAYFAPEPPSNGAAALGTALTQIHENRLKFPTMLKLEEQALFDLGYYHQKAADVADAIRRKQERERKLASSATATGKTTNNHPTHQDKEN